MRRTILIALSLAVLTATAATAAEKILSTTRTGTVAQGTMPVGECRSVIVLERWDDGKLHRVWRPEVCTPHARNTIDMGCPPDDAPWLCDQLARFYGMKTSP